MRVMYFCCCCSCVAAAAVLLFAAAVRHRVPDDAILLLWFIATDSVSVFSLFIPIIFIFNAPLGSAVARTASIYLLYIPAIHTSIIVCILGNYGHVRSQGGRQPAATNPPLNVSIDTPDIPTDRGTRYQVPGTYV